MKPKLVFLAFAFFISTFCFSQNWFPLGAKWHYHQGMKQAGWSYKTIEVVGDTMLAGIQCAILLTSPNTGCALNPQRAYVYETGGRVYYYEPLDSTFHLLYDFNVTPGNSWTVIPPPGNGPPLQVNVDSISYMYIGTDSLKVIHFSHPYHFPNVYIQFDFYGPTTRKMIETIGSDCFFFPNYSTCDPGVGPIRCYNSTKTGFIDFDLSHDCDWAAIDENVRVQNLLNIVPNPAEEEITIHFPTGNGMIQTNQLSILISDILGKTVHHAELETLPVTLNIRDFPSGIYFLQIQSANERMLRKFVKK